MNEYFVREGFSSYYVMKREEGHEFEEKIMAEQGCEAILHYDIRRVDEESFYYYKVSGYRPLLDKMREKKNSVDEYKEIYRELFRVVEQVEEYLLPPEGILLSGNTIFYDETEKKLYVCYLPGQKKDMMQQLLDLTEEFLEIINYEDRVLVEFLYGVHEVIAKGKLPNMNENDQPEEAMIMEEADSGGSEEAPWNESAYEYNENDDRLFFQEEPEIKQSGKWYMEIGISILVSMAIVAVLVYQIIDGFHYGFNSANQKYIAVFLVAAAGNFYYLIRKAKVRAIPEKFTTILTEEESADKIGGTIERE